jgi:hypothetical protein
MGKKWEGGDMNYPGGGWKVNLLKQELDNVRQLTRTIRMIFFSLLINNSGSENKTIKLGQGQV